MASYGFLDSEEAQGLLWTVDSHKFTAVLKKFQIRFQKQEEAHFSTTRAYQGHQKETVILKMGATVAHGLKRKGIGLRNMFTKESTLYLGLAATGIKIHHTIIWFFFETGAEALPVKVTNASTK